MKTKTGLIGSLTTKLIACLFILICLALGAVGLILPIIPGLLFLAIALMIIAKLSPSIDRQLRKNRTISSYLDSADGFLSLSLLKKVQYGCLLCLQLFIDAIAFCVLVVTKLLGFAVVKYQSYR